jgi:hypothetical protein
MDSKTAGVLVTCGDEVLRSLAELIVRLPAVRVYRNPEA